MKLEQAFSRFPHPSRSSTSWGRGTAFSKAANYAPTRSGAWIERSWLRCHGAGVDPARAHAPDPLSEESVGTVI